MTISLCSAVATPTAPVPDDGHLLRHRRIRSDASCASTLTYRSDIVVPLIGALLSTDGNGRFVQTATATMVVN